MKQATAPRSPSSTRLLLAGIAAAPLLMGSACAPSGAVMPPPTGVAAVGAGKAPAVDPPPSKDEKPAAPKWDVGVPPGERLEVPIDTSSGTWMSVDVSPDGREIVFDLLGDLYLLPFAGGEAKALTSGVAWDMQPRFSHDGKHIAFTSDRGGGDNIWVVDRAGGPPRAVTEETFRLLNSPAWSPDDEYLVARKHFTERRSLGSGEIWLYHRAGGEGIQLTEKPNEQKDVGEPAFSADGRYVYFSQDVTPGDSFDYNKDPYGRIYAIKRVDLDERDIETIVDGAGGAVRPTPSPNGRWLAFVRRVGLRSVLHVMDLESRAVWPLFDGLDRDMQETWAIHGVYPAMAWTPDSQSIVLWAGGKLRRVYASNATSVDIPFHVHDTRSVAPSLQPTVDVAPANFDVKAVRWAEPSPDGSLLVYQALGRLYLRNRATGVVKRLTTQEDHLESHPSFSRDGKSIVYVTWDDRELGSVRVIPTRGGAGRVVSRTPGHFVEPVFTPDGKQVVYRRTGGGSLRSPRWTGDPGLYLLPLEGDERRETRIVEDGRDAHFGAAPDRLYFTRSGKEGVRVLVSTDLAGHEEREHFQSEMATEYRVSPDGRWLAFAEGHRAFVTAFPLARKVTEIGPKSKALPLAQVSDNAGYFLRWSGDAARVHWTLGSQWFTRELPDAFAFLAGAPAKLPEPSTAGVDIGFSMASDVPKGKLALVGARLVTMKGEEVVPEGTVVVEGNRIVAIGPTSAVAVPADAKVIDVRGQTIIPGLVDVHAHGPQGEDGLAPETNWLDLSSLSFGVTTIHDPSNDTYEFFSASERARAGHFTAPRLFSTGTILYGAKADFKAEVESLDDARKHLARMKAIGAFSVKSYNQPRRDQRQQVIAAARELGMAVVPEGGSLFQHNMTMVVDGHTGIEHAIPVAAIYDDVKQLWGATGVGYTPTLVVAYGGVWGENYWYQHTEVWQHERLLRFVPREQVDPRARRRMHVSEGDWNHIRAAQVAKSLADAGVEVNLGAHGQREGLAAHWELWMMVQGGMSPHEALRAGTLHGARYLGLDHDLGSLEVGKLADLAVLEGDVLADIRDSERVKFVMANGRLFDAMTLEQLGNAPRPAPTTYWKHDEAVHEEASIRARAGIRR